MFATRRICICISLLIGVVVKLHAEEEGDFCEFDGKMGVCVLIDHCDTALANFRKPNFKIKHCGFREIVPIVCCVKTHVLSFKKCLEYQSLLGPDIPQKPLESGIIGGEPAEIKEFPHMALLAYSKDDNNLQWLCGGSLISTNYVLTAAHCLTTQSTYGTVKKVLTGTTRKSQPAFGGQPQILDVKRTIVHPGYKRPRKYDDIGLLELDKHADLDNYVKPVCLHLDFGLPTTLTAAGFGKLDRGNLQEAERLLKVDLIDYNNTYCNEVFETNQQIPEGILPQSQICAGSDSSKPKDTCQGASGGPLHYRQKGVLYLAGVTSFGLSCGLENIPGIYTRVSNYLTWIEDNVWK